MYEIASYNRKVLEEIFYIMPDMVYCPTVEEIRSGMDISQANKANMLTVEIDFDVNHKTELFFLCSGHYMDKNTEHLNTLIETPICTSLNLAMEKLQMEKTNNISMQLDMMLDYIVTLKQPLNAHILQYISIPFRGYGNHYDAYEQYEDVFLSIEGYKQHLKNSIELNNLTFCSHNKIDVILSTLNAIALANKPLNKCALCGKYFVPSSRADEKYCDFESPQYKGKSCKEAAKLINQKQREANNEVINLSKKIYNRLRMRAERNNAEEDRQKLYLYQNERELLKAAVKAGQKTEKDLLDWLKNKETETR